ncbi:nuclear transport factor 2 family protein [Mesorhizobium sp.]|uniref:nuclear transport factor 2 family protein n=1 Tax=Mesorhizobium sp. TaxID=1871066 RepID=UPI0025C62881|nr:nuclear transport factor 2 family protein [Mesorhizobium sp.]
MMHDQLQPAENSHAWLERNKATVLDFIERSVNQGNIDAASVHFGESYTQHNPNIADGVQGFREYLQQLRQAFPLVQGEVKRIFADGDFVIVHMHARREPEEAGLAIVDFFRLAEGKLVEHWEVRQPIVESNLHANAMI